MLKKLQYGLMIMGLISPFIAHADACSSASAYSSKSMTACDVTMTASPTFTNLCIGVIEPGTYTIRNNTPVAIKLNYIRIQNNDSLPALATAIVTAPNNCGTSLAAGASCNILLNLQPLAQGMFNRILQVGIDTRQVQVSGPAITASSNCTPVGPVAPTNPPVPTPPSLVQASIIAFSTITNTGPSVVNGDVDLSPGTSVTGFPPGTIVNGTENIANGTAATALANANTYFTNLNALTCNTNLTGQNLGGMTLTPGTYCFSSSAQLTGALTLSGAGNYTFQIGSTLTTASGSSVVLTNGATAANVNWAVGSSATVGTTTLMVGNIDASASITLNTGASLNGRAWALNGAVSLDTNAVNPN